MELKLILITFKHFYRVPKQVLDETFISENLKFTKLNCIFHFCQKIRQIEVRSTLPS